MEVPSRKQDEFDSFPQFPAISHLPFFSSTLMATKEQNLRLIFKASPYLTTVC